MLNELSEFETVPVVARVPAKAAIDVPSIVLSCLDRDVTLFRIALLNVLFNNVIWLLNEYVAILKKRVLSVETVFVRVN